MPGRDSQRVGLHPKRGVRPGARGGVRHGDRAGAQAGGEAQVYQGAEGSLRQPTDQPQEGELR